jgi:hypothetical protein
MRFLVHPAAALVYVTFFRLLWASLSKKRSMLPSSYPPTTVQITDRALSRGFSREIAEREIRSALTVGDINLWDHA